MKELRAFAEMIDAPVTVTLLGIGGFPANHQLSIGMMGMHGEAWVNPCREVPRAACRV